jgi:RimJ/RimL family protein N-acetyltransferase
VASLEDVAWPRRTERLVLRPATTDDTAARWAFRRLPEVSEWLQTAWTDEAAFTAWAADRLDGQLVVEADGVIVGDAMSALRSPWSQTEVAAEAEDVEASLAWVVDPSVQGRGYAIELATELLVIAFDELGLRRVVAELFADNGPSRRLAERIGMREEARNVEDSLHRERGWIDGMTYALLADEWRSRRGAPAPPTLGQVAWPRRTERLLLRRPVVTDLAAIWRYVRRPEVTEWLTTVFPDEDALGVWFDEVRRTRLLVVEHEDAVVGHVVLDVGDALGQVEVADRTRGVQAEVGYVFDPDVAGRGLATEAVRELLVVAFDELGLRRVFASCFADNTPSWKLMERLGMRRELASVAESLHRTRGWLDGYEYALLASEWRTPAAPRT